MIIAQLSFEQKLDIIRKLREKGYSQEKVGKTIGLSRRRIGQIEQNISMGNISHTNILNLRYKLTEKQKQNILDKIKKGETQQQIASDYGISKGRVSQVLKKETEMQKLKEKAKT